MKNKILTIVAAAGLSVSVTGQASAENITVQSEDTLWGISVQHNVSVTQLKDWNELHSNIIYPGDQLTISNYSSDYEAKTYTVRSGDSLWAIANTYDLTVSELQSLNQLSSTIIHPGDTLIIDSTTQETTSDGDEGDVVKTFTATATAYTANCAGCSGITATGVDLKANPDQKVISVDPDVIPLGSTVWVEGYGYATAEDIGGSIYGNAIDVFIPDYEEAIQWGRKSVTVKVYQ
ncbi:peptidoglycan-binding protein [Pontibacillus chungwhensis BH030062]|uniref:Peptidoglycan-binding protein n=1 Tax=Pontibacillus chungwhensis BH030062 TaxID=1385513 RepID=A0A0A2V2I8_9BACI|nr:3D domain-containing protein [Pontibacillus chungwhensis]KGP93031.1 peptidoglycan-binding protein [Pontibacillus chungwhensis BH030062]